MRRNPTLRFIDQRQRPGQLADTPLMSVRGEYLLPDTVPRLSSEGTVTLNDLIQVQSQRPQLCVILAVRWEPRADLTVWFHWVSGGSRGEVLEADP